MRESFFQRHKKIILIAIGVLGVISFVLTIIWYQLTTDHQEPIPVPTPTSGIMPTPIAFPTYVPPDEAVFTGDSGEDIPEDIVEQTKAAYVLRQKLPVIHDSFTLEYNYADAVFVVYLNEPVEQNRAIFNSWLLNNGYDKIPDEKFTFTTSPQQASGKILVDGVIVNDFYKNAESTLSNGDALLKKGEGYQISYVDQYKTFKLTITGKDFSSLRKTAEETFLTLLGVSQNDVCRLIVDVTSPSYATNQYAGQTFRLSFCE